ncbi:thiamine pyrophosphate-binding protein [Bradyrhizobium uaiense]|uniref:Thiamine pyrophosphate-binding protein n=1 Tax=Bradyrhizobium uaiense TaxID=2594946 RepID=A0A6P1BIV5_9BRAD|nr:thiamine pyrophosphate-dependent enzyme [Bradyrhizobium uaiense]NEU98325.1 thiamine pyrophosphate-binding protein [Bradyrhizobium uaiense]
MSASVSAWSDVARFIESAGASTVFGIPGDDLSILQALEGGQVNFVVAKDQRNAMFMATGYALAARKLSFCIVGKGPAVTNTLTGVLESRASCAPVVVVAVGTARNRLGARAFQELDQVAVIRPLVKWAFRVEHADRLPWAIQRAAFVATNDCPGPVYIEIPEDLAESVPTQLHYDARGPHHPNISASATAEVGAFINRLERPLFLLGGGSVDGRRAASYGELASRVDAAVFTTASGRGAINERDPLFCGLAGLYTAEPLRVLWEQCDGVVSFGSRLEETATLLMDAERLRGKVLQINVVSEEISSVYSGPAIVSSCAGIANALFHGYGFERKPGWSELIRERKALAFQARQLGVEHARQSNDLQMAAVIEQLEKSLPSDAILVQENGLLDMWSYFYPYFTLGPEQQSIVPSEQASLGFGVAAAIGAKAAKPDRPVIALVGDGAFNIGRSDLSTAVDYALPVTYVVLNNEGFGWLEYQWRKRGFATKRFAFTSNLASHGPGVAHFPVDGTGQISRQIAAALERNKQGQCAIVEIRTNYASPAPGVEAFDSV